MDRHSVALVLDEIATLLELHGENKFKVRAYAAAAKAIEEVDEDLPGLVKSGGIAAVPGIGPATRSVVEELVRTGASRMHERLLGKTPSGFFELLRVPRLGPGRIHALHQALGIETVADLEEAARCGRIAGVRGFGPKTQANILEGIAFVRGASAHRLQTAAYEAASRILGWLEARPEVRRAKLSGALRRRLETVEGVDALAEVDDDHFSSVLEAFLQLPGAARGARVSDDAAEATLSDGFRLGVRCASPANFAVAWLRGTGSEEHVRELEVRAKAAGLELRERGLYRGNRRRTTKDEETLYRVLGLDLVPPELREGRGEVEAAAEGALPGLVDYSDLRGCFHNHTTWSDGTVGIAELAEAALERGWRYLGIADHSQVAGYAGGLSADDLRRQRDEVLRWNEERGDELWIFQGVEADILADGRLDYSGGQDDAILEELDYVVGSVHSSFALSEAKQTERVLRALEDPRLTILGHATGRLLLRRDGYPIDLEAVIEKAAEEGKAIEINANPRRLDMGWPWWKLAKENGVKAAINPDAHSIRELDNLEYGVGMARKGWLEPEDVVNAWELERVSSYFEKGS